MTPPAEKPEPPSRTPQEIQGQLDWERRWRARAAAAAGLGAALPLLGFLIGATATGDAGPDNTSQLIHVADNPAGLILSSVILGLGALAIGAALVYLFRATAFRRPIMPRAALYTAVVGAVAYGIAQIARQIVLVAEARDFASTGSQTYEEAKDVFVSAAVQVPTYLGLAGQLALGFALVMIALNAMRAGLLTRFMGILGVLVGVLTVIPLGSPLPIVQSFWLGALAALFVQRWPSGTPEAWDRGIEVPWPSQQEIRERREREGGGDDDRPRGGRAPAPAPVPAAPEARPHSSSKKRKRKKRR